MPDARDELDTWLAEPVQPLHPEPGVFDQIRRRARRRKTQRAAAAVAAGLAAITVVTAVPRLLTQAPLRQVTATGTRTPFRHSTGSQPASPSSSTHISPPARHTPSVPTPAAGSGLHPSSVTFVSTTTGWALGQAQLASGCGQGRHVCEALAKTGNYGGSWHQVRSQPIAAPPQGGTGVSQVRFLETLDGWAFGPQLLATHDGGLTWKAIATGGLRVTALETAGHQAFAVWARCSGSGAAFAATCTTFSLYTATATSNHWVAVPHASGLASSQPAAGQLVVTQQRAYLLGPGQQLLSGPTTGHTGWTTVARAALPCAPGAAQPDGQPSRAMIASNGADLILLCAGPVQPGDIQAKTLYYSANHGRTWRKAGTPPTAGTAQALAGSPGASVIVVATSQGLSISTDGGITWRSAQPSRGSFPAGGFSYVGMTFSTLGVAVPAGASSHSVWVTHDGGLTWQRSRVP